jgi:hypothetical protein
MQGKPRRAETRAKPGRRWILPALEFRAANFGLRTSDFFRISAFGFRILGFGLQKSRAARRLAGRRSAPEPANLLDNPAGLPK